MMETLFISTKHMHFDKQRFLTDKTYALGWALLTGVMALVLVSVFLTAKTVTEVITWTQGQEGYPDSTISVTGEGEVVAVPDVATFNFSVNVTGESVEVAQTEVTKIANEAVAYLKENGVAEKDVKTTGYNAYPRYEYGVCRGFECDNNRTLVGYEVTESFEVTVRDTTKAGELLAGVGATGITNVSGLSFTIDDPGKLQEEARSAAVADARAQAEKLAKDLGVSLKDVVSFSEDQGGYYPQPYMARGLGGDTAMEAAAIPDLPTGENTVTSRVYITYEIR